MDGRHVVVLFFLFGGCSMQTLQSETNQHTPKTETNAELGTLSVSSDPKKTGAASTLAADPKKTADASTTASEPIKNSELIGEKMSVQETEIVKIPKRTGINSKESSLIPVSETVETARNENEGNFETSNPSKENMATSVLSKITEQSENPSSSNTKAAAETSVFDMSESDSQIPVSGKLESTSNTNEGIMKIKKNPKASANSKDTTQLENPTSSKIETTAVLSKSDISNADSRSEIGAKKESQITLKDLEAPKMNVDAMKNEGTKIQVQDPSVSGLKNEPILFNIPKEETLKESKSKINPVVTSKSEINIADSQMKLNINSNTETQNDRITSEMPESKRSDMNKHSESTVKNMPVNAGQDNKLKTDEVMNSKIMDGTESETGSIQTSVSSNSKAKSTAQVPNTEDGTIKSKPDSNAVVTSKSEVNFADSQQQGNIKSEAKSVTKSANTPEGQQSGLKESSQSVIEIIPTNAVQAQKEETVRMANIKSVSPSGSVAQASDSKSIVRSKPIEGKDVQSKSKPEPLPMSKQSSTKVVKPVQSNKPAKSKVSFSKSKKKRVLAILSRMKRDNLPKIIFSNTWSLPTRQLALETYIKKSIDSGMKWLDVYGITRLEQKHMDTASKLKLDELKKSITAKKVLPSWFRKAALKAYLKARLRSLEDTKKENSDALYPKQGSSEFLPRPVKVESDRVLKEKKVKNSEMQHAKIIKSSLTPEIKMSNNESPMKESQAVVSEVNHDSSFPLNKPKIVQLSAVKPVKNEQDKLTMHQSATEENANNLLPKFNVEEEVIQVQEKTDQEKQKRIDGADKQESVQSRKIPLQVKMNSASTEIKHVVKEPSATQMANNFPTEPSSSAQKRIVQVPVNQASPVESFSSTNGPKILNMNVKITEKEPDPIQASQSMTVGEGVEKEQVQIIDVVSSPSKIPISAEKKNTEQGVPAGDTEQQINPSSVTGAQVNENRKPKEENIQILPVVKSSSVNMQQIQSTEKETGSVTKEEPEALPVVPQSPSNPLQPTTAESAKSSTSSDVNVPAESSAFRKSSPIVQAANSPPFSVSDSSNGQIITDTELDAVISSFF